MRQAVVLAAGKGIRMLPLTKYVPKPLVPINGKPFLSYLLSHLEGAGYEKVFILVGHKKDRVEEFFEKNNFSFKTKFIHQEERLGTGHAVGLARDYVEGNFVVLMGDNLYSKRDISSVNFEDDYNYIFALEHEQPQHFGVLNVEKDFLIEIEEKPSNPKSNLINAGFYKFTPEIFEALDKIEKSERGEYELTSAIQLLAEEQKVKVEKLKDYFVDLGKYEDIPKVQEFIKNNDL